MAIFSGGKVLDLAAAFGQGRQDGVAVRDGLVTREFDRTGDGAHGRNAFVRHGEILARSAWRRGIARPSAATSRPRAALYFLRAAGATTRRGCIGGRMVSRPELRRIFRSPVVMVVVALAIRLAVMGLMYGEKKPITRALFTLPSEMARVASSIASGEGFASPLPDPTGPTAWVVPVYAYLLAGVFRVFGVYTAASAVAILTINSLFSALTCLPIHTLARKSFGPTVATAAGWTWVVFPYAVYTPVHWIWEACLATLLLTLLVLLAVRLDEAPSLWAWGGLVGSGAGARWPIRRFQPWWRFLGPGFAFALTGGARRGPGRPGQVGWFFGCA